MSVSIAKPEEKAGLYSLMNRLLMKGTEKYSSEELSAILDENAIELCTEMKYDYLRFRFVALNEDFEFALSVLSDIILDRGGVIYGCELQDCRKAIHTRATTKEQRDGFRGSKYIQSETYHIFEDVKNDVKNGLWVLFSGTSCQVNAVKDFCKCRHCTGLNI